MTVYGKDCMPESVNKPERLDKLLSNSGVGTRSEVKKLICAGLVSCNGFTVKDPSAKFDAIAARICVGGVAVKHRRFIYIMMNKPKGVISSTEDPKYPTVLDVLPNNFHAWSPFPVGRLDIDTTGLLLLTNDGALAHDLLSPKHHIEKEYVAALDLPPGKDVIDGFARGVALPGEKPCKPASLIYPAYTENTQMARIILTEGKYHQVKRMFALYNIRVLELSRIRMGGLKLDLTLPTGMSRELTDTELILLKKH